MRRNILVVGVVGASSLVAGTALIYPPAALIVAGVLLLAYAWLALDALGVPDR